MKHACRVLLAMILAVPVSAAIMKLAIIGPSFSTSNVTIAANAGGKSCITDVDVTGNAIGTFRVLDGGTTIYSIPISSGATLIRSWSDEQALCGTKATAMYLTVGVSTYTINYGGYVR